MLICVLFHFSDEQAASAATGVEGEVTDMILPCVGDLVRHADSGGTPVLGRVTERVYVYDLPNGINVDGSVTVTIMLQKMSVQKMSVQ